MHFQLRNPPAISKKLREKSSSEKIEEIERKRQEEILKNKMMVETQIISFFPNLTSNLISCTKLCS